MYASNMNLNVSNIWMIPTIWPHDCLSLTVQLYSLIYGARTRTHGKKKKKKKENCSFNARMLRNMYVCFQLNNVIGGWHKALKVQTEWNDMWRLFGVGIVCQAHKTRWTEKSKITQNCSEYLARCRAVVDRSGSPSVRIHRTTHTNTHIYTHNINTIGRERATNDDANRPTTTPSRIIRKRNENRHTATVTKKKKNVKEQQHQTTKKRIHVLIREKMNSGQARIRNRMREGEQDEYIWMRRGINTRTQEYTPSRFLFELLCSFAHSFLLFFLSFLFSLPSRFTLHSLTVTQRLHFPHDFFFRCFLFLCLFGLFHFGHYCFRSNFFLMSRCHKTVVHVFDISSQLRQIFETKWPRFFYWFNFMSRASNMEHNST